MAAPWYAYPIGRGHDPKDNANGGELGVDLSTPLNTAITAPFSGVVTYAGGNSSTGGIVKVVGNLPGAGTMGQYFLHLRALAVKPGQQVSAGQLVGLSGGDQPGAGGWPHVEYGLFDNLSHASEYWGFHTGDTLDPTKFVEALHTTGGIAPGGVGTAAGSFLPGAESTIQGATQAGGINITMPSSLDTLLGGLHLDVSGLLWRSGLIIAGLLLILFGLVWFILPTRKETADLVGTGVGAAVKAP